MTKSFLYLPLKQMYINPKHISFICHINEKKSFWYQFQKKEENPSNPFKHCSYVLHLNHMQLGEGVIILGSGNYTIHHTRITIKNEDKSDYETIDTWLKTHHKTTN